jgi:penicillin-binding protein 1A
MVPPPRQPAKTILGSVTQAIAAKTRIHFSKLKLKTDARVPELWVQENDKPPMKYQLLGDYYRLGRSSQQADIVIRNPVVSQYHLSLARRPSTGKLGAIFRAPFVLQDENSTNGVFRGKRQITSTVLRHNDLYTLGPTELADVVQVRYVDPPAWYQLAWRYALLGLGGASALATGSVLLMWQQFSVNPLPVSVQGPVIVYARDGETQLRRQSSRPHGEMKQIQDYSKYLPQAVIASEDSRYYWHFGVDPIGTLRAIVTNVRQGGIREGGSTLTQQLARSILRNYVGTQDSAGRKLREAAVALKLETIYSKDFLLLTYLNRVYMGNGAYGFEDAAQFYFAKSARDLSLSEAAALAGILPAPNSFNPVQDYRKAIEQRNGVLQRMQELGMISSEEASQARRSPLEVNPLAKEELRGTIAPYFYAQVFNELEDLLGPEAAQEGNFIVETGLDPRVQRQAEQAIQGTIGREGAANGFSQGALVTLNASNGEVVALVGGDDYQQSQFNRATQALRQPGSTFKVFAYTAAIEQGVSTGKSYSCAGLDWQGQYFEGCPSGGSMDMATGLAQSANTVALRVGQDVGLDKVAQMAKRLGVDSKLNPVPGMILGQSEVTVLEMTGAFGAIANGGVWHRPRLIRQIRDGGRCQNRNDYTTCSVAYTASNDIASSRPVLDPTVASTMTSLLQGVVRSGTGRAAGTLGRGEAGKTGTTNDNVDKWFIGFVPGGYTTGIWFGNDDNKSSGGSSAIAAQAWGSYMSRLP